MITTFSAATLFLIECLSFYNGTKTLIPAAYYAIFLEFVPSPSKEQTRISCFRFEAFVSENTPPLSGEG